MAPPRAYASGDKERSKASFVREMGSKTLDNFLMAAQAPNVDPADMTDVLDPRFATPFNRIYDINRRLEAVRLYGTEAVFAPMPTFFNSDDNQQPPDGPADDDFHEYEVDPWGRPRESLLPGENPFADLLVTRNQADDRRNTDLGELPHFGNFGPYFRKVNAVGNLAGKFVAPKHVGARYDITPLIDEKLKTDPLALNPDFDDWRREVEFQFGEKPPLPPPSLGPAPDPGDASFDFSSLAIILNNRRVQPLLVPHPSIRSPLAPQKGTDEEMNADMERINSLSVELSSSWWIANILWCMGEDDTSLARTSAMMREGVCPPEVFPYYVDPNTMEKVEKCDYVSGPLALYVPFRVVYGSPDPTENTFWVPKLKGVDGSAMRFMRPPFPEYCTLDTRFAPVPVLQSTVLPERHDIGRPELKLWDGIPGRTFRLPPYFWPDELRDSHLDGEDRPFAVDIRRIPVKRPAGNTQTQPQPPQPFRPTRRLNTVYRDRTKVPQNPQRIYNPGTHTPTHNSRQTHGPNQLGGNVEEDDNSPSFLQDEFEYDLQGDVWGPIGGFEGRDYESERQKDHDRWYRYFLINNDPWDRTIIVNGVQVKPGAVAGPLPAFAMLELDGQAAFWFGVGGRNYDPNTAPPTEKRAAENEAPGDGNRGKVQRLIPRPWSPGQETGGTYQAFITITLPTGTSPLPSPATATAAVFENLQIGQTQNQPLRNQPAQNQPAQNQPVKNQPVAPEPFGGFRADAPEFVPGSSGGLVGLGLLGLRGGAGTEDDLDPVGSGASAARPAAKRRTDPATDENIEKAMGEAARQMALAHAAAGALLAGGTPQQESTGTPQHIGSGTTQNTSTETAQNTSTETTKNTRAATTQNTRAAISHLFNLIPYQFTPVALQPMNTRAPQYMTTETPPYMNAGALESLLERYGICVDPSWDKARLLNELLKVKIPLYQSAERADNQTEVAQAERKARARARAERMISTVSENSELEQRHMCEGLGIIISPEWSPARIREEIARLYETAYQELMSNNNAATEYEAAMGLLVDNSEPKKPPDAISVLFFLASRYMYRQRSGAGLKAMCEKYCIDVNSTWDSERVIVEILRAVEWQRQVEIARAAADETSILASIAAITAIDAETDRIRAKMAEMVKVAKEKAGRILIDLTGSPTRVDGPTVIDLTGSPTRVDLIHGPTPTDLTGSP
ncbi:hypothetical protein VE01_01411 [Pseudogymnoascus verrucosus]|uniref:Uncharacterized protein n=1 Tax=Pseudogymnoascus verrucosus TaxID=342668 RepID=A0A1B8GX74_9PEZI|nr:uncharacterized protein VE01_01411 [Pseudogymnoascus verrucosus]OBU00419.1 hypothetical protein VE01_01411 [Pseudogymnoascus verrucosus]